MHLAEKSIIVTNVPCVCVTVCAQSVCDDYTPISSMAEKNAQKSLVTVCEGKKSNEDKKAALSIRTVHIHHIGVRFFQSCFCSCFALPHSHAPTNTNCRIQMRMPPSPHTQKIHFFLWILCLRCCCCCYFFSVCPPNSHTNCSLKSKNVENSLLTSNYGDNSI